MRAARVLKVSACLVALASSTAVAEPTRQRFKIVQGTGYTAETRVSADTAKPPRLRRTTLDLNGSGPEILIWYELPNEDHALRRTG